jgi:predicted transcriptional regulator
MKIHRYDLETLLGSREYNSKIHKKLKGEPKPNQEIHYCFKVNTKNRSQSILHYNDMDLFLHKGQRFTLRKNTKLSTWELSTALDESNTDQIMELMTDALIRSEFGKAHIEIIPCV